MTIHLFHGRTCVDARNPSASQAAAEEKAHTIQAQTRAVGQKPYPLTVVDVRTQRVLSTITPA